jgi:hypothetical protein
MSEWEKEHKRHRRFQVALTLGSVVGAALTVLMPQMAEHAAYVATLTSLAWIWEK